jgi:16S rRNA processing protein RimM
VSVPAASASTSSTSTVAEPIVSVDPDDLVVVGRIGPVRGVHGDVFVAPFTDAPDERFAPGTVLRTDPASAGPLTVATSTSASGKLVVHFEGVDGRPEAEALRGVQLVVPAGERPRLEDPDEFYDTDLIGLTARAVGGDELGPVSDVIHVGGAHYLVLQMAGREQLIPFVAAIVPTVDLATGTVLIDPPEGLFDV